MKRIRGRSHRHGGGGQGGGGGGGGQGGGGGGGGGQYRPAAHQPMSRNHVFDSNGPDMRLRGTAQQLFEKYLQLGRDATGSGDRVMAESYFQHAEHYFRILNAMSQVQQQQASVPQQRRYQNGPDQGNEGGEQGGEQQQPEFNGSGNAQGHGQGHGQGQPQGHQGHAQGGQGNGQGGESSQDEDQDGPQQPQPHQREREQL
ncbi:DUF4167 domain-containing protein [Paeniroseomonas aquatica]